MKIKKFLMKLSRKFYCRDTKMVAKELLGKILVHKTNQGILKGKIVETEAYLGENDPGSIGARKVKNPPKSLLNPPGYAFIYFTYGNHWMLNVIVEENKLGAVLIRALEPLKGIEIMKKLRNVNEISNLTNGPGKLTKAFDIDKRYDGSDLTKGNLFVENFDENFETVTTTRIGLSRGEDKLLRFYIKDNKFVSKF